MSTNFRKAGNVTTLTATAAVSSDDVVGPYGTGSRFAIAITDADAGANFSAKVSGVYELPASATDVWAAGDNLYWDAANSRLTDASTGNQIIGPADGAKIASETTANVLLNGTPA